MSNVQFRFIFILIYFFSSLKSARILARGGTAREAVSVLKWADELSKNFHAMFDHATKIDEIRKLYANVAEVEEFDPAQELKTIKLQMENYLQERSKTAWDAKVSLESKELPNIPGNEINDPASQKFARYYNVKKDTNAATMYVDGPLGGTIEVNATRKFQLKPNPNFYQLMTNSETSAVHIPTPMYNRDPYLLERIVWSDIDQVYRRNREHLKDLWFQKFCSETGFMRFFPAASWTWDSQEAELDIYDCRSTEWYVDASSTPKNVMILLDTSGSMLGQRFEIARQTIEAIFGTLSDNDFVNILAFSKMETFMEDCAGEKLIQATLRNKKVLLGRLSNISSEGKAGFLEVVEQLFTQTILEYEKALIKAFTVLMGLPENAVEWRTKEEQQDELERYFESDDSLTRLHYIPIEEHYLVVTDEYMQKINEYNSGGLRGSCQDIIILITDGSPSNYRDIFELYNNDKRVGQEVAKDFEHVKWMACNNRGFMSHIKGLGDISEKVQVYAKTLSKVVSRQAASIHQENAVWSTSNRERMSDEFVISVSYPVVLDENFMGVASTSIPLMELMDQHDYVLFHPQLRPIDTLTNEIRPTYNNIRFAELLQTTTYRKNWPRIHCSKTANSNSKHLNTLFALGNLRHIYPQKNTYFAECINRTPLTLVVAIAEHENSRLKHRRRLEYSKIDLNWLRDNNWRIHPRWRYCSLNDSDGNLSPEEGFTIYAQQMKSTGELPELCKQRGRLVNRLLLDLEATSKLGSLWNSEFERQKNQKNGIHLTFFAASSGLIRFINQTLSEQLYYEEPYEIGSDGSKVKEGNFSTNSTGVRDTKDANNAKELGAYKHFVLDLNKHSTEDDYYRRAVRQPSRIVIDLNFRTLLWHNRARSKKEQTTTYGHIESESLLAMAFKAVQTGESASGPVAGVAGIEFLFDQLASHLSKLGCDPNNDRIRCYLLDENAYVVYTSQKNTFYSEFLTANKPQQSHSTSETANIAAAARRRKSQLKKMFADPQYTAKWHQTGSYNNSKYANVVMGKFFGHINRITEWSMELLIKNGFYTLTRFLDAQSMCELEPPSSSVAGAASALTKPLSFLIHSISQLIIMLATIFLIPSRIAEAGWSGGWAPVARTTSLFKSDEGIYPCSQVSIHYTANYEAKSKFESGALLEEHLSERPCKQSAAQCVVKLYASWVQGTNLLLVVVRQGTRNQCYNEDHCPLSSPSSIPFGVIHSEQEAPATPIELEVQHQQLMGGGGVMDEEGEEEAGGHNIKCQQISTPARRYQHDRPSCLRDDLMYEVEEKCSATTSFLSAIYILRITCIFHFVMFWKFL